MQLLFDRRKAPIGTMLVVWDEEERLRSLDFEDYEARMHELLRRYWRDYELKPATLPAHVAERLDDYYDGAIERIDDIEVVTGGTDFQQTVWHALRKIRPGETTSYGRLADLIGRSGASRAVGLANGSNPVALVVPCHRVIGANGSLTGYGGGLHRKQWLLDHERRYAREAAATPRQAAFAGF
jgi:methylated-DNA-[protein]-cysteine S-methyltransferase